MCVGKDTQYCLKVGIPSRKDTDGKKQGQGMVVYPSLVLVIIAVG